MFEFSMDQNRGILYCLTTGFWDLRVTNRYWDEIELYVARNEREYGRFTFLNDATGYFTQTPEVQAVSERRAGVMLKRPENRIAIVVKSSLLKLQARRVIPSEQLALFLARDEAEAWLNASLDQNSQTGA